MSRNYLLYGASRGLGNAILKTIPTEQDKVFAIARRPDETAPVQTQWINTDLSQATESLSQVKNAIQQEKIDCLIYNVGIWEQNAFSDDYDFSQISSSEILNMVQVNIASCIIHIQGMLENLKKSPNAKIILIGSTWGLDNHNGKEVIFSACKHALRGIAHALRENVREDKIGVTVLNLGYLATEYSIDESVEDVLIKSDGALIPLQDVIAAIQFVLSTSNATCVKEIDMPAMLDINI